MYRVLSRKEEKSTGAYALAHWPNFEQERKIIAEIRFLSRKKNHGLGPNEPSDWTRAAGSTARRTTEVNKRKTPDLLKEQREKWIARDPKIDFSIELNQDLYNYGGQHSFSLI
jgi:hypothetical protein